MEINKRTLSDFGAIKRVAAKFEPLLENVERINRCGGEPLSVEDVCRMADHQRMHAMHVVVRDVLERVAEASPVKQQEALNIAALEIDLYGASIARLQRLNQCLLELSEATMRATYAQHEKGE